MAEAAEFRPRARAPRGFRDRRAAELALERRILAVVAGVYEILRLRGAGDRRVRIRRRARQIPARRRPAQPRRLRPPGRRRAVAGAALRPDRAPGPLRGGEPCRALPRPFRRYAMGPVWRNEKPGPGRDRQFTQCDADTVGSDRPEADAELIAMACAAYARAGARRSGGDEGRQSPPAERPAAPQRRGFAQSSAWRSCARSTSSTAWARAASPPCSAPGAATSPAPSPRAPDLGRPPSSACSPFCEPAATAASATLAAMAEAIGGSAEGEAGLAELAAIDAALARHGSRRERRRCSIRRWCAAWNTTPARCSRPSWLATPASARSRASARWAAAGATTTSSRASPASAPRRPASRVGVSRLAAALAGARRGRRGARGPGGGDRLRPRPHGRLPRHRGRVARRRHRRRSLSRAPRACARR